MRVPPLFSSLSTRSRRKVAGLAAVQQTLFRWQLSVSLIFGLPAVVLGVAQAVRQGRWLYAVIYCILYLLAVLDLAFARRLPFRLGAGFLLLELYALAIAVLLRVGIGGAGIPFLITCCVLSIMLFDLKWAVVALGSCIAGFVTVAVGMVSGFFPAPSILSSLSPLSWFNMGAVFLLVAVVMMIASQVLRSHLEGGLDRMEETTRELESANRLLLEEDRNRRAVEEALRKSEERYRLIVENAHDAIFIAQDGLLKFPNRRVLEITGYGAEEILSIPFPEFIHPEDRARVVDNYQRRLRGESVPSLYSFRVVRKGGEEVWIELSAVQCTWEGRPATLNFVRDITTQKRLELNSQQAQKLEAIGTLAGGIAHDFNNLLQVIRGYAELLAVDPRQDPRGSQEIAQIEQATARGSELVRQLLLFSRKMESALQPMDLNRQLEKSRTLLTRLIPRMIGIELSLSPALPSVKADPGQMEQVLMNLAINARDAMPQGGTLTIETESCELSEQFCRPYPDMRPGMHARLRVSDTGEGIDGESLPHVFEPFYTTKGVGKGTGLGLAIVYGIVRNHHGAIACDSTPGVGTRFTIYLPLAGAAVETPGDPSEEPFPRGSETILLVDDEESLRALGQRMLRQAGYEVLVASDGESALEIYRSRAAEIHLVILDLIMPGMGGRRCLEEILRANPRARVLITSGYVPDAQSWNAQVAGAVGLLMKPYRRGAILEEIRKSLDAQ